MSSPVDPSRAAHGTGEALAFVASLVLGAVFVLSAATKILSPKAFLSTLETYQVLPAAWNLPAATGVVGLELGLGLLFLLGPGRRTAAWIALPLVVAFIGLVAHAMRAGLKECGCFGEVLSMPPRAELILDIVLLILVLLVLRHGRSLELGSPLVAPTLGWGGLALGGALFLAGGPVSAGSQTLDSTRVDLDLLAQADPPLEITDDAFLFFFSADCDHCWAYAGAVQLMQDRLEGIEVHAVTFSDRTSLEQFREAFHPTYPIHVLDEDLFDRVTDMYPAAVWIQAGEVAGTWSGFVPSHREIAEAGGYSYRPVPDAAPDPSDAPGSLFGGPVRGR